MLSIQMDVRSFNNVWWKFFTLGQMLYQISLRTIFIVDLKMAIEWKTLSVRHNKFKDAIENIKDYVH